MLLFKPFAQFGWCLTQNLEEVNGYYIGLAKVKTEALIETFQNSISWVVFCACDLLNTITGQLRTLQNTSLL